MCLLVGEKLHSNLSRMTMVVWLFVALVITQSFTASLTSLLTVQQLDQTTIDIETLKKNGAKVGCDANSFVGKYLEVVLGFQPNNIRRIGSGDYYPQALKSGEIAAAFIEAPYVKVFLAKYCEGFITSGPAFKVGGFGFVSIHGLIHSLTLPFQIIILDCVFAFDFSQEDVFCRVSS